MGAFTCIIAVYRKTSALDTCTDQVDDNTHPFCAPSCLPTPNPTPRARTQPKKRGYGGGGRGDDLYVRELLEPEKSEVLTTWKRYAVADGGEKFAESIQILNEMVRGCRCRCFCTSRGLYG